MSIKAYVFKGRTLNLDKDLILSLLPDTNLNTGLLLYPQDAFLQEPLLLDSAVDLSREIVKLFSEIAFELKIYISPGSIIVKEDNHYYREGVLLAPDGELVLRQKQLFLTKEEREAGLSPGEEVSVLATELGNLAFMVAQDAWYPEVGRFISQEGAEIVLAPVNYSGNWWRQLAGVWNQVQQNQFFALEANKSLGLLHGPCEITPYKSGILAPMEEELTAEIFNKPLVYLNYLLAKTEKEEFISGELSLENLKAIKKTYPLKKFLNGKLYQMAGREKLEEIKW